MHTKKIGQSFIYTANPAIEQKALLIVRTFTVI